MAVQVRYFTDPACSWSWITEPAVRRLMVEFGDDLEWTYVMGGLARSYADHSDPDLGAGDGSDVHARLVKHWLDVADSGRMPLDPRLWTEAPIASTYPACIAVKAAADQCEDRGYAYLRAVREGLFWYRRKLDNPQALTETARGLGLDVTRFRSDLLSSAMTEAFSADLDAVRDVPDEARADGKVKPVDGGERLTFPSIEFTGEDGAVHGVYGFAAYESYADAALRADAQLSSAPRPGVADALARFGRMALPEVEAVCGLPTPVAAAQLWTLTVEWKARPVRVLSDHFWERP